MYIKLTDKVKVLSPLDLANVESYEGNIENVDLLQQKKNYHDLLSSFQPYNVTFDHIWFGKFKDDTSSNRVRYHFLARSGCHNVYWRKYEAISRGSGRNELFINGAKIKLSLWLCMSENDRHFFLKTNAKMIADKKESNQEEDSISATL